VHSRIFSSPSNWRARATGDDLSVPRLINKPHDFVSRFGNDLSAISDQASEGKLSSCGTHPSPQAAPPFGSVFFQPFRPAARRPASSIQEGLPDSNVPSCSACHGPEAKGQDEIPRLAGQLFPYTVKELTNWSKERGQGSGSDTSAIMVPTAHNLTQSQIAAIAAYVSYLP
jgi:cytochrome c553